MSLPILIYTVRRNTQGLLPHEKAPAVRQFETYSEAASFVENSSERESLHITTDKA